MAQIRRIIPAYAGSTRARTRIPHLVQDHPRIRGEHVSRCGFCVVPGGSSPHTRGAPGNYLQYGNEPRIIPAYAGSTRDRSIRAWQASDHPRIRGEHFLRVFFAL